MPKTSLLAKSLAKLLEHQAGSERYVDVCISLRVHETDEELIRVGGRWDRKAKRYVGDAGQVRVLHVHKGQLRAARWFAEWLRRRATGDWKGFRRVWSALFVGGRRGGKSRLAVWAVCLFAVMKSGSESWCISPTQEETEELEKAIRETLPGPWFRYRGDPKWEYRIANGSVIRMLSGHKPSTLKRGRVDFALYNEGQLMSQKGYVQLRGATADSGGLTIIAANPPDTPIGRWIEDLYEKARAANDNLATAPANDNLVKVAAFEFDPADNPFIEYQSLLDLAAEVDEHTFLREVRGVFVPIGDVVLYAWSDSETIRDVPAGFEDVTEAFTRQHLGRAFKHVVGVDFQRTPHMAAVVLKIYVDPADPERAPLLWAVDEFVLSDADEDDVINALEAPGLGVRCPCCADTAEAYLPAECAVVADASGEWQDADRTKGKGSYDWFRKRGWRHIYQPDDRMKKNPEITERVKVANALLKSYSGRRRFFSCRHNEHTNRSSKRWENRNGVPYRKSDHAHVCDAWTYPCWRFFPRRRAVSPEIKVVAKPDRERMDGWSEGDDGTQPSPPRPGRRRGRSSMRGW